MANCISFRTQTMTTSTPMGVTTSLFLSWKKSMNNTESPLQNENQSND